MWYVGLEIQGPTFQALFSKDVGPKLYLYLFLQPEKAYPTSKSKCLCLNLWVPGLQMYVFMPSNSTILYLEQWVMILMLVWLESGDIWGSAL